MSEFGDVILNSGDVNQVIADLIGRFVMDLYHSCLISKESGWVIEKRIARSRFQSFIKNKENAAISETYKLQYTNGYGYNELDKETIVHPNGYECLNNNIFGKSF
ncbi:uncharacterized protein LOC119685560 [Teleopsis dalmanni]|uniref:uncharacterized protein LOC119685560 n=1 Tax=Teleopsis dalmanni TaxID=139649 RepID=UPI0018CEE232|nr:uncharacterized protein LOC119685560 [Teleopsis dalmanni]